MTGTIERPSTPCQQSVRGTVLARGDVVVVKTGNVTVFGESAGAMSCF